MNQPRKRLLLVAAVVLVLSLFTLNFARAADRGAWAPNTAYAIGDTVTYGGHSYQCRQAHTSLVSWEPPNTPALWLDLGGSNPTTPPPTTPPPTTPPPTTPPPTTPPPTTQPPSGNCWAAWVASQVYTGGAQVSRNNVNYQAAYWTQNNDPATNSGPAGSGQPWIPKGACSGGTATTPPPTTPPPTTPPPTTPPPTTPPPTTPPPTNPPGGSRVLGYFVEWGIYGRNYQPKNLVTSGSASKITHINFAFGNVTNGQCVLADSYADYDKFYDAASSVDGTSDSWDAGSLRGIFGQFRKLKAMYPNIKILWSFGGWTYSGGFGQAAANPTAFANSCYNLVHDARWNGVFDGIDIDWEYPNACGLSCDSSGYGSYKTLMQALRNRFGSELVTAAVTASAANVDRADYAGAAQYVDWYNIMTYDYFGAFNPQGPTAPHSPLSSYSGIPTAGFDTQDSVAKYRSIGIPASKLMAGIGFYGRGWTGVSQSAPGGSATGPASGQYEAGINDYKVLASSCPPTGTVGGTAYAYCGNNWWSYDTPSTIASKMSWMKSQGLGGAFFWEFSGDTSSAALLSAIYNNR